MEILLTHLLLSLYTIGFILIIFGIVFVYTLWSSKDFSNSLIVLIFLLSLLIINLAWRIIGLPELTLF